MSVPRALLQERPKLPRGRKRRQQRRRPDRQNAKQKMAAKQAADAEDGFDDAPELSGAAASGAAMSSKRAARSAKMTRKEARAARIAAEQAEEEEEIQLRDPAQAQRAFKRRAQGLSARSIVVLILAVAAAYLSLAPGFDVLPLPLALDVVENPTIGIGVLLLLQFIALFVGIDVFGMGFYNLLHGMP